MSDACDTAVEAARRKAWVLYEGRRVPHHSCGICLAATFNLPTTPYQSLRRGGITGEGTCGAIKAGEMILGQYLGDPDPTGPVTDSLREAIWHYRQLWTTRLGVQPGNDVVCNTLVNRFDEFMSEERKEFCTRLSADVAAMVAETLQAFGVEVSITPVGDDSPQA